MLTSPPESTAISPAEFALFQKLIFEIAGISLPEGKKPLLVGRLARRLKHHGLTRFSDYYHLITREADQAELQIMVDLLTTNETFFFREPRHFDFLGRHAARVGRGGFRAWSAASSSGEEAYSMAMVLAETLGERPWEVVGTDISQRVLEKARSGHYSTERISGIPLPLLKKYCLKGFDEQAGTLLITSALRERVRFEYSNLMRPVGHLGQFDVIFLRNVMIYFTLETKRRVVANLLPYLKRDGLFFVGHSESLNGISESLVPVEPTIYRRCP